MGKNKYYCRINGRIENLKDIQELIDADEFQGKITLAMYENHNMECIDASTFEEVIKFNNKEIPADYNEALKKMQEYNRASRENLSIPHCPRCGSTSITTGPRGFSTGRSFLSRLLGGNPVESGLIGSGNTVNRCANCGHTWSPKWKG